LNTAWCRDVKRFHTEVGVIQKRSINIVIQEIGEQAGGGQAEVIKPVELSFTTNAEVQSQHFQTKAACRPSRPTCSGIVSSKRISTLMSNHLLQLPTMVVSFAIFTVALAAGAADSVSPAKSNSELPAAELRPTRKEPVTKIGKTGAVVGTVKSIGWISASSTNFGPRRPTEIRKENRNRY